MIANLRYFVDSYENRIYIKWNWLGVNDSIQASCILKKTLTGEQINQIEQITLTKYNENAGGCRFDMPDIPVTISICEDGGTPVTCKVSESPRYKIQYACQMISKTVETEKKGLKKLFGKKDTYEVPHLKIIVEFPQQISDDEIKGIDGWVFCGNIIESGNQTSRFFLPYLAKGLCTYPPIPYSPSSDRETITIGCTPLTQDTRFADLFAFTRMGTVGEAEQNPQAGSVTAFGPNTGSTIDFSHLLERDDSGFYRITCPFCFHTFSHQELEYRAKLYEGNAHCFEAEEDVKYKAFCQEKRIIGFEHKIGKALSFSKPEEIDSFTYISNPSVLHKPSNEKLKDVVNVVIDKFGNRTSEKLCPHCHNPLPIMSGKLPNIFISMMGNTGSGKTMYMIQLIHMLDIGMLLPGFKFTCSPNNNSQSLKILEQYKEIFLGDSQRDSIEARHTSFSQSEITGIEGLFFDSSSANSLSATDMFASMPGAIQFGEVADYNGPRNDMGNDSLTLFDTDAEDDSAVNLYIDGINELNITVSKDSGKWDDLSYVEQKIVTKSAVPLPEATTPTYKEPCIYTLSGKSPDTGETVGFILSIFDFPGEAIWDRTKNGVVDQFDRYLEQVNSLASGFVFMFDPLSISRVRNMPGDKIDKFIELSLGSSRSNTSTLLRQKPADILNSFRRKYGDPTGKYKAPIAMVLSKVDAIRDLNDDINSRDVSADRRFLEEKYSIMQKNRVSIDVEDIRHCSEIILSYINEEGLRAVCDSLAEEYMWFSVSATGVAPKDGSLCGMYGVPVRVLDPIEWILLKNTEQLRGS